MKKKTKSQIVYESQIQTLQLLSKHSPNLNKNKDNLPQELTSIKESLFRAVELPFLKLGISRVGLAILAYLSEAKSIRRSDLAKRWGVDKGAITGVIKTLKKTGFVAEQEDLTDKRASLILLTEEGKEFFDKTLYKYSNWLFNELNISSEDEREQLIRFTLGKKNLFSI